MSFELRSFLLFFITVIVLSNNLFNTFIIIIFSITSIFLVLIELNKKCSKYLFGRDVKVVMAFLLIWIIYSMLFLVISLDLPEAIENFKVLLVGIFLIMLITITINSKEKLMELYKIWGYAILLMIILGWIEYITGISIGNRGARFSDVITVNYYNPNNYSFLLTISLPIMFFWIKNNILYYKMLGLFMYFSSFYFIFVNKTRLSLLLILFITIIYIFSLLKNRRTSIIATIILVLFFLLTFEKMYVLIEQLQTLDSNDGSLKERNNLTSWALDVFYSNPLGVGPGQAKFYMPISGLNIHNFWLEFLANFGIFIFTGLILFFLYFFYKILQSLKSKDLKYVIAPLFWVVILFIPAANGPSTIYPFGILWFVFSIMLVTLNIINKERY